MYKTTLEADVKATMRDGVVLRADVFRPDVDGQIPRHPGTHAVQQRG